VSQGVQQDPEIVWVTYSEEEFGELGLVKDFGALLELGFETLSDYAA
jgi:hypothetical protein